MSARVLSGSIIATVAVAVTVSRGTLTPIVAASIDSVVVASFVLMPLLARLRPGNESISEFDAAMRRGAPPAAVPADFARADRLISAAMSGDELLDDRFAPYLQRIVAQRLAARRGIELARSTRIAELVSPDLYALLEQVRREDRFGPQRLSNVRLEQLLAEVEAL